MAPSGGWYINACIIAPHQKLSFSKHPPFQWMSSVNRLSVNPNTMIALSAAGWQAATCNALNPLHDLPIIPTAPLHQVCRLIQSITYTASSCSCYKYSSRNIPSDSPEPRISTRTAAIPCPAKKPCMGSSRVRVPSRLRYGMYYNTAGQRILPSLASLGIQHRAASLIPSDKVMNRFYITSTSYGMLSITRIAIMWLFVLLLLFYS